MITFDTQEDLQKSLEEGIRINYTHHNVEKFEPKTRTLTNINKVVGHQIGEGVNGLLLDRNKIYNKMDKFFYYNLPFSLINHRIFFSKEIALSFLLILTFFLIIIFPESSFGLT